MPKGEGKRMDKIKSDMDTVKRNRAMMKLGWFMLILSFVFSGGNHYAGNHYVLQFVSAAAPWVIMGAGIACIAASISRKKREDL